MMKLSKIMNSSRKMATKIRDGILKSSLRPLVARSEMFWNSQPRQA